MISVDLFASGGLIVEFSPKQICLVLLEMGSRLLGEKRVSETEVGHRNGHVWTLVPIG